MYSIAIPIMAMVACVTSLPAPSTENFDLLMSAVKPKSPGTYLCTSMEIKDKNRYLTGFQPKADSNVAHHILLYGCSVPGVQPGKVWNCGEMTSSDGDYEMQPVCQRDSSIVYAWAMDAPKLELPEGVGFDVGQDTEVKYLVVQVHYKNVTKFLPPVNGDDSSGLTVESTLIPTQKKAGVYLISTGGFIPAHSIEYFEAACTYLESGEIKPFAYRTHAHVRGRVLSGYRIRNGEWEEIGRKDPRKPEMFYDVTNPGLTVRQGDILAARCTMENTLDHDVHIGATKSDEMCNFYIMYSVERPPYPKRHNCYTPGPPTWFFKDFEDQRRINIANIPDTASVIPGESQPLKRNASSPNVVYGDSSLEMEDVLDAEPNGMMPVLDSGTSALLDEAIDEMDPDELDYLVEQLAAEEAEQDLRNRLWQQRQYEIWLRRQQDSAYRFGNPAV